MLTSCDTGRWACVRDNKMERIIRGRQRHDHSWPTETSGLCSCTGTGAGKIHWVVHNKCRARYVLLGRHASVLLAIRLLLVSLPQCRTLKKPRKPNTNPFSAVEILPHAAQVKPRKKGFSTLLVCSHNNTHRSPCRDYRCREN